MFVKTLLVVIFALSRYLLHILCLCFCMSVVISSFRSWITGVCSPYVVSLCDFAYYVFG